MIIDLHLAVATPPDELDAYGRYLAAHGALKGWESATALVENLDRDGVTYGILLHGPNRRRAEFSGAFPKRLGAFAAVSMRALAKAPEQTLADARARIEDGFLGFGTINPYREGFALDDPPLTRLFALAAELDVPVHLECTCAFGRAVPGRVTTPLYDFEAVARRFPALRLILGSWGAGLCLFEMMPELPRVLTNVYYDTASPVDAFDIATMLATVPKIVRHRKILFGSASPLRARHLAAYRNAPVPSEVLFGVLGNNARLMLKLP